MKCRHCNTQLKHTFIDLGNAPPSNAFLKPEDLRKPEVTYPLRLLVCDACWLVQTEDYAKAGELFRSDYAYFSSTSSSWLTHAEKYCKQMKALLNLDASSYVIEIASNDGYLLKNFLAAGIPCLGIEPTASTAVAAESLGIQVNRAFFGEALGKQLAKQGKQADLIIANNVYAHVPDINDFTKGLKAVLKPGGTLTLEFPHVMRLINEVQFDTIYHEHFSYLSLYTVERMFSLIGLRVLDVEELPTHGGSLRVFGCHDNDLRSTSERVKEVIKKESDAGIRTLETYSNFQTAAEKIKNDLLSFLINKKYAGKKVAAYGAAAKGNTLLNFAGIRPDLLPFVYDAALSKQGKYMPGSHIPIIAPDFIKNFQPDYLLILPWNIADEIKLLTSDLNELGVIYITAVPELSTFE